MLDSGQQSSRSNTQNCVRLLKVALKAARFCLDQKQAELCLKVLERAAHFEDDLAKLENQISPEDGRVHLRLKAEYFILRTALVSVYPSISFPRRITALTVTRRHGGNHALILQSICSRNVL